MKHSYNTHILLGVRLIQMYKSNMKINLKSNEDNF